MDEMGLHHFKPIFYKRESGNEKEYLKFCSVKNPTIVDACREQLEELFLLRNPQFRFNRSDHEDFNSFYKKILNGVHDAVFGYWVYYPWLNIVVHLLPEDLFFELRTGRNRELITTIEQKKFYDASIAIAGLSVGSHIALTVVMMGGCKRIRLADPDKISCSNLNRVRLGVPSIGINKSVMTARLIYEMNPYAEVEVFESGITDSNIDDFLNVGTKNLIVIEEMDHPMMKLLLHQKVKEKGLPLIMATDNANGVLVDMERHDLNKDEKIFNGRLDHLLKKDEVIDFQQLSHIVALMAGANDAAPEMLESVLRVGKTLYSWPQLGSAATLCGAVGAFLVKSIALGKKIRSGRGMISLEKIFLEDYEDDRVNRKRNDLLTKMFSNEK